MGKQKFVLGVYYWNNEDEVRERIIKSCAACPNLGINENTISFEEPASEEGQGMVFVIHPDSVVLSDSEKEKLIEQLRDSFPEKKPRIIFYPG